MTKQQNTLNVLTVLQVLATGTLLGLATPEAQAQTIEQNTSPPVQTLSREDVEGARPANADGILRTTPVAQPTVVEKFLITGSSIKRVEGEGPVPVEIITRKTIERSGATSVNELIRSIPSIDIYDQSELDSGSSTGSGTASIRMRGLDENSVLVLLNGRRLPINALYDATGIGAAVDINMIPINAIERIEILKDGGSAIYGADAVAGVVNFITKKDYNGLEATLGYGQSSRGDGTEKTLGVTGGFGHLDTDGYNVILALNSFQREPIYRKDRDISRSSDFRRYGGNDARSILAPQGNFYDPLADDFTGTSVTPCPPELYNEGLCRYDVNASLLTAYNGADRQGAMALGTLKLTPDIYAYAQLFYARAQDDFETHPIGGFFEVPVGTEVIAGRFLQGGPRTTKRKSTLEHFVVGIEGTTAQIDWDVAYTQGKSKVTNRDRNYFSVDLYDAIFFGDIDPTVTTNDPALVESLKLSPVRVGESGIKSLDAKFSGELMQMPAGPLGYAVGASIWQETLVDTPDPLSQQGLVLFERPLAKVDAERDAKAIYAELNIPVLKNLEVQTAVRRDIYDTAAKTSPKIAARWKVIPELAFRASYATSFRMPSLKQIYGAQEDTPITINNVSGAANCEALGFAAGCSVPALQVQGGNPELKPEIGKTFNFGVIFDAGRLVSGTLDYWKIRQNDNISIPTIDQAIAAGKFTRDGLDILVFTNLQNFAKVETSGLDLDLTTHIVKTPVGALTLRNFTTYYLSLRRKSGTDGEWEDLKESYVRPKWRNTFSATLDKGPWSSSLVWRYTGGFFDSDAYPTASDPRPVDQRRVPSYDETDVLVAYSGIKNMKLGLGVKNIFDAQPPFSAQNASNSGYTQMGFAELYTSRGRFFYANANYTFK